MAVVNLLSSHLSSIRPVLFGQPISACMAALRAIESPRPTLRRKGEQTLWADCGWYTHSYGLSFSGELSSGYPPTWYSITYTRTPLTDTNNQIGNVHLAMRTCLSSRLFQPL